MTSLAHGVGPEETPAWALLYAFSIKGHGLGDLFDPIRNRGGPSLLYLMLSLMKVANHCRGAQLLSLPSSKIEDITSILFVQFV